MSERNFKKAVRINSEKPVITNINTKTGAGGAAEYSLISIPFYLTEEVDRFIWNLSIYRNLLLYLHILPTNITVKFHIITTNDMVWLQRYNYYLWLREVIKKAKIVFGSLKIYNFIFFYQLYISTKKYPTVSIEKYPA